MRSQPHYCGKLRSRNGPSSGNSPKLKGLRMARTVQCQ